MNKKYNFTSEENKLLLKNYEFINIFNHGLNKNIIQRLIYFFGFPFLIMLLPYFLYNICYILLPDLIKNEDSLMLIVPLLICLILGFFESVGFSMSTNKNDLKEFLEDIEILKEKDINDDLIEYLNNLDKNKNY